MDIFNETDFPALSFRQIRAGDGAMMACLTVKATCDLVVGHPMVFSERQDAILDEDTYVGDPHKTALVELSDLVPFRPAADLTLVTNALPPDQAQPLWFLAGCVIGAQRHRFRIEGNKQWVFSDDQWRLQREAVTGPTALHWANTFGGIVASDDGPPFDVVRENPLGCGAFDLSKAPTDRAFRAPIVTDPDDPVADAPTKPVGCAPVPPWWRSRQQHAGTYDDAWLDEVHPRLPDDFDYAFYQAAAPQLVQSGYFEGGEPVRLVNVLPELPVFETHLPTWGPTVRVRYWTNEVFPVRMNLDGCHISLAGEQAKAVLTWRAWLQNASSVKNFQIGIDGLEELITQQRDADGIERVAPWEAWLA